jgi:hypothetical protein
LKSGKPASRKKDGNKKDTAARSKDPAGDGSGLMSPVSNDATESSTVGDDNDYDDFYTYSGSFSEWNKSFDEAESAAGAVPKQRRGRFLIWPASR